MARTFSNIEKIRAELSWVTETPDPNKCGCVTFDAARKPDIGRELASARSPQSFGRSDGNTTVRLAANMDGADVSLVAI